jgi:hypothetical protein
MGESQGIRRLSPQRESQFPRLARPNYEVTSDETAVYNCIAYAADDTTRKWGCPDIPDPAYYWPPGARRGDELAALVSAFEQIGYELCDDRDVNEGYDKVVLYADRHGDWTHAAKQLSNGQWSSKLGDWEDIRHEAEMDVGDSAYGLACRYMRRRRKG